MKKSLKVLFVAIVAFLFVSAVTVQALNYTDFIIENAPGGGGVADDPEPEFVYPSPNL